MDELPAPGAEAPAPVPTCFRHPDRETYLSCSRCGRPACPDCLRAAPVGQHCVECVREGHAGSGGRPRCSAAGPPSGAIVTWVIVGLNVLFYLVEWVYPRGRQQLGHGGASYGPNINEWAWRDGQWYRLHHVGVPAAEPGLERAARTSRSTCGR